MALSYAIGGENHDATASGLHVDRDPTVRAKPAQDAWRRLRAYFARILGGTATP